jgi:RimJ/RimL family protein N-acetyltransferase
MIGEKEFWGKGYGTEINNLVLDYGFRKLNLHKIYLGVNADNKGAVKSYKKSGFKYEGTKRDEIYRNGRYYDAIMMSILRNEYKD